MLAQHVKKPSEYARVITVWITVKLDMYADVNMFMYSRYI